MNLITSFRERLNSQAPGEDGGMEQDFIVRVCMHHAEDERLSAYVVQCADALIEHHACTPANAKALFFALERTGDNRYETAIRAVLEELNAKAVSREAPLSALAEPLPFRMAYEMKLNRMEGVGRTAAAYRQAHLQTWDEKKQLHRMGKGFSLREEAAFLLALTDGIAACSEQLYEHWRALVDLYRVCLSGVLRHLNAQTLLTSNLKASDTPDLAGTAIVLYALLTGVQLGLIDPERYLPLAQKCLAALRQQGEAPAVTLIELVFGVKA